jgi:hypothetical protein
MRLLYERAKEGEVGRIIYWEVTGAKDKGVSGSGYIFDSPYALALPCRLFLVAWSRAAAQEVPPEQLLQFRYSLLAHSLVGGDG